jgi:5-methyltetrahydrofolate--homocysteine methyltransferase
MKKERMKNMSENNSEIITAVLEGDEAKVKLQVMEAVNRGERANDIMSDGLIAAMDIVGKKMESEEMFIPEVLMSAQAMEAGVSILKSRLTGEAGRSRGVVVLGSVFGDMHDIGKNLVKMMLEGAGYDVIDLGVNVRPEQFISAVRDKNATLVGMSSLLTTTMPVMKEVIDALEENGLRNQVKVIIGGAPVDDAYAEEIGADACGTDAGAAVRIAKALV